MHQMVLLEVCDFNKRVNVTIAVTQPQKMDLGRDQVTHLYLEQEWQELEEEEEKMRRGGGVIGVP